MPFTDRTLQAIGYRAAVVIIAMGLAGILMFLPSREAQARLPVSQAAEKTTTAAPAGYRVLLVWAGVMLPASTWSTRASNRNCLCTK